MSHLSTGIAFCGLLLSGCASFNDSIPTRPPLQIAGFDGNEETEDGQNRDATNDQIKTYTSPDAEQQDRLIFYRGAPGALSSNGQSGEDNLAGRTLQLNFVDAPAADVARTIIADALGQTISIADGVTGTITLTAPEPAPARAALEALELALAESQLTLIESPTGFLLTKLSDAANTTSSLNGGGPIGYGVTFAPVKYASPSEISRLIGPFTSDRVTITPDDAQNVLVLQGPRVDVNEALEAIETFDAPFLTDRIFGLFKIQFANADTLKGEIETLLTATSGNADAITLTTLPRLNMIFVTARSQAIFDEANRWIEQFDAPSGGAERRLRYYPVQYTPADVLATQLNAAFGGGGGFASPSLENTSDSGPALRDGPAPLQFPSLSDARISISADTLNNALLIQATDQEYAEVLELVEKMDVPAAQVLIEATIAEVTLTSDLAYGVRWFFENAESKTSFPGAVPRSNGNLGPFNPITPGFNYSYFENNVSVALDALSSVTDVQVLSAPSIMVLNNQSANLQVGDEVPIVTQQAQGVGDSNAPIVSTLQLRETGVILEVKPRINASDTVVLEVTQEVSDVTQTTTSGIDSPTIQQRRFTSTVAVKNNGTVALGGLIRETYTDNDSGVPVLKDVPVLGNAFKSRDVNKRRTELIIFLTPRIIRTEDDADRAIRHFRREMNNLFGPDASDE